MLVHKVRLKKIESSHTKLRTNEVVGITNELPTVGESFALVGESLTKGMDARLVHTTEIQSVDLKDSKYTFKTHNSTYELEILSTEEIAD